MLTDGNSVLLVIKLSSAQMHITVPMKTIDSMLVITVNMPDVSCGGTHANYFWFQNELSINHVKNY